jgi:HSP20 family protein
MAMCKVSSSLHFAKHSQTGGGKEGSANWAPNTDVYATDGGLVIKVELAGMRREDLELTVEGNLLKISGQRPDGCRAPKCKFLVMAISYGPFETVIELPAGYDLSRAKAAYQNGFLRVDVPVLAPSAPKSLSISGE